MPWRSDDAVATRFVALTWPRTYTGEPSVGMLICSTLPASYARMPVPVELDAEPGARIPTV